MLCSWESGTHHVDESDVEEHPGRHEQHPRRAIRRLANDLARHEADVAGTGRQEVEHERLLHRHAGVEQNREVTYKSHSAGQWFRHLREDIYDYERTFVLRYDETERHRMIPFNT